MSGTFHHRGPGRHAPSWFRRVLNRLYRRQANLETARYGDVVTKKPREADWEWW